MKNQISIIICTRNRADSLQETLTAIGKVKCPAGCSLELIVADNGSNDHTKSVVDKASMPNCSLKWAEEHIPGQSRARNLGLSRSSGEIIVFTDDDVRPSEFWLELLCRPILERVADGVQGGVFLPPSRKFPWMTRLHMELFASTAFFVPGEVSSLWGANMAFRRDVLDSVPAFDVELGPGALGFADDALFTMQMKEAGYRLIYVPEASLEHWFDTSRLTSASFRSRAFRDGQSRAYVSYHWEHTAEVESEAKFRNAKLSILKHYVRRPWRLLPGAVMNDAEFWMHINAGFYTQLDFERQRPRRYAKRGLRLLEQEPKPQIKGQHVSREVVN